MAPLGELELWSSFLFVVSRFCSAFTDHPLRFMHSHSLILSSWDPLRRRRHHRDPWKRLDLGSFGSHTSSALFSADLIVVNLLNALEPFVESGRLDRFSDLSFFLFLDRPTLLFFCSLSRASSQRSNLFSTMDKMILPFVLFVLFLSGRLEAVDSTRVATRLIPFLPLSLFPFQGSARQRTCWRRFGTPSSIVFYFVDRHALLFALFISFLPSRSHLRSPLRLPLKAILFSLNLPSSAAFVSSTHTPSSIILLIGLLSFSLRPYCTSKPV